MSLCSHTFPFLVTTVILTLPSTNTFSSSARTSDFLPKPLLRNQIVDVNGAADCSTLATLFVGVQHLPPEPLATKALHEFARNAGAHFAVRRNAVHQIDASGHCKQITMRATPILTNREQN